MTETRVSDEARTRDSRSHNPGRTEENREVSSLGEVPEGAKNAGNSYEGGPGPEKVCLGCGESKPLEAFYRNKGGLHGRQSKCKPCFGKRMRESDAYRTHQAAREAVRRAVKSGRLVRPEACVECGAKGYTHGHHDDYSKPLDVRWLCKGCHEEVHRGDKYAARVFKAEAAANLLGLLAGVRS